MNIAPANSLSPETRAATGKVPSLDPLLAATTLRDSGPHVLLVDDEHGFADGGRRVLEWLGYRVTAVANAAAALQVIRAAAEKFDCILTDCTMPGLSGIELAYECRRLLPATPIILMSRYCGVLTEDSLRSHGICALLLKPFSSQTLAETLRRALTNPNTSPIA